jgi:hypothetical protein
MFDDSIGESRLAFWPGEVDVHITFQIGAHVKHRKSSRIR